MIKRTQYSKITSGASNGTATEAKQDQQITLQQALNLATAKEAKQDQQITLQQALNLATAKEAKQDQQIGLQQSTEMLLNSYLNNIDSTLIQTQNFLTTTSRFNNGLTTTSFTATSIVLLNTAIQLFINANPLRTFKAITHATQGTNSNALLIHSL